jgi:hypothetical protein
LLISAAAIPRSRFEPDGLVATLPNLEITETKALVVEVFPFVPETQIIFLPLDNSIIALGNMANKTRPEIVSPDLRKTFFERSAANFAIRTAILSLTCGLLI